MSMNSGQEKRVPPEYDLISTTTPDSRIMYANEHFTNIVGYSSEELEGQYHNIVRHPDMPKAAFKDMWDHLKDKKSWMGVVKNRCKNGDHYWVNAYVTPILDNNGNVFEYQSVRTKPSRADIERAAGYYQQINQGKLPRALRLPTFNISLISLLLSFGTIIAIIANMMLSEISSLSSVAIGLVIIQSVFAIWWGKKLKTLASIAKENFNTDITQVLYTGRRDELAAIELALRMKKAELRAIVGRTGDTCNTRARS